GAVSGTGSLTVNGNTTVALDANNTYTGPTTISSGTLQVGNFGTTGSLGSTSAVTNNSVLAVDVNGPVSFPYVVTGSGSLEVQGQGTVSLAGSALSYLGSTEVSNGIVKLAANNEIPNTINVAGSTGGLSVDGGTTSAGTLDLNGFNATVNSLAGAQNNVNGIITNGSTTTTTTNVLSALEVASSTYNGEINDHGATGAKIKLFVTGPGTLTLNPTNSSSFSGGIIVSNGSLALGTPGANGVVNINESQLAPGTGPITLLGTNTILTLDGVTGSTVPTYAPLTNNVIVPAGQNVTVYGPCRGAVSSALTGSGILNYDTTYFRDAINGNWSAFTGQVIFSGNSTGGNIGFAATNGLANCTVLMNTDVALYCTSAGSVMSIGALAGGDSSCQLEGIGTAGANSGAQNTTFSIGGLNTSTVYTGGIIDTNNLLKVGTGTLTLNCGGIVTTNVVPDTNTGFNITVIGYEANIVTYAGTTTVSNGVLALDAPVVLNNSTHVTIASPTAELDASDMGYVSNLSYTLPNGATQEIVIDSTFEVVSNQSLGGIGTLNGFVQADPYSTLAVGLPTGTFNVTSNASLSGVVAMHLDDTDAVTCSTLAAPAFTINSTATLVVTNVGPGLTNGVSFTLFNQPVTGFASVTLPATDPTGTTNYLWQNNLAVNGSITLTNGGLIIGPSLPPHITYSLSGNSLSLSWPPSYLGYILQAQTNSVATGLSTNWVNVSGSSAGTNMTVTVNPANGTVFYRLMQ
ncbi:MAG TPA: autotransporter-associated beta strand repeat-containing protein, partial [Verrucomicrobiae bacterium]|nr:autotransporter-associated beta strand repeat-containing protein [Verrucomicrobiae bacterium]